MLSNDEKVFCPDGGGVSSVAVLPDTLEFQLAARSLLRAETDADNSGFKASSAAIERAHCHPTAAARSEHCSRPRREEPVSMHVKSITFKIPSTFASHRAAAATKARGQSGQTCWAIVSSLTEQRPGAAQAGGGCSAWLQMLTCGCWTRRGGQPAAAELAGPGSHGRSKAAGWFHPCCGASQAATCSSRNHLYQVSKTLAMPAAVLHGHYTG